MKYYVLGQIMAEMALFFIVTLTAAVRKTSERAVGTAVRNSVFICTSNCVALSAITNKFDEW